ncbi:MAG: ATP-dependent DNA helicase [Nitrospirota bacterium]
MLNHKTLLLDSLTSQQADAVRSPKHRVLVVAGAGSGKTEVMARRIAWWVAVDKVAKDQIVAFTFTERAAEVMKFRIRSWITKITPPGEEASLGQMYIGTIHGYCLSKLREWWPDDYHNYDILDQAARTSLIQRGFNGVLGLQGFRSALSADKDYTIGQYDTIERFSQTYDLLHEHDQFKAKLASGPIPIRLGEEEREWCKKSEMITEIGTSDASQAFALSAARYYAYLRRRRFLDFSTSQTEFLHCLRNDLERMRQEVVEKDIHLVVDEVQDINPVQLELIKMLALDSGKLTAVGDHRQGIYGFRGAKVDIIAQLWKRFKSDKNGDVIGLGANFRSTENIIELANSWAGTITPPLGMESPAMTHGNKSRKHAHASHLALTGFPDRNAEADWIADAIKILVPSKIKGARHDKKDGTERGISLADIAVLVRSSTDVRTYMEVLEKAGVPSVVRAGPDLFSQPEVMLFVASFAISAGVNEFYGASFNPKSLPNRIKNVLGCEPNPLPVLHAASTALRRAKLPFQKVTEERLLSAAIMLQGRIKNGKSFTLDEVRGFRSSELKEFLRNKKPIRRVFPQQIYHWLLFESEVDAWDTVEGRGQTALFHLGAFSKMVTGIETPGWTSAEDYSWQVIGLCQYGSEEGKTEEQPLMVQPEAVTISTIHSVKGLEFAAVFLADVCSRRFPSQFSKRGVSLPVSKQLSDAMQVDSLSDNDNYDGERRLMYVALTRAERFLFVTHSSKQTSQFIKELRTKMSDAGGMVSQSPQKVLHELKYAPKEHKRDINLATSFSDLRYYLECPHDFYLRKVLGFAPTIDQAFGYGRGVHNLMRAIHSDPKGWAAIAANPSALEAAIQKMIDRGLFYLRYTTGEPADNMRSKGLRIVADYVKKYASELQSLGFEPEKPFETLVEYPDGEGGALVTGAIDIIRQDDPPRVTLIDFKSGDERADAKKLDEEEMALQIGIYACAAKSELEYEPEQGMVRYLDSGPHEKAELLVPLNPKTLAMAKITVSETAYNIRERKFKEGPRKEREGKLRCITCDFLGLCGMNDAMAHKKVSPKT